MSSVVVDDLRHEMDENVVAASATTKRKASVAAGPKSADVKASFLIRTLPRDCNPTPVPTGGMSASASGLLSPLMSKIGSRQEAELEILQLDNPFDDITEEKLRQLTGSQDLERVTSLQISVDSSKQSVETIGELLPSLQQLRLQQSTLSSFRDLGTSLRSLRILWAMHCQISDLDGIGALLNLQELYLQHNNVSDISPLTMHDELRVVDLEGNRVADIGQTEQLGQRSLR
ncbi:Protein phosphatase 1, regulatory subunit [Phytophthora cinnamomi]|uniref:Protein phosphatase 1, regulatory subunit n=1 Tax=Phytophthora cinnamomi TaxID=4785 RepID=UPI00355A0E51|nr:Protein phosphatase 1, regulatory subunit [Phytophthora cinnamomi]